MTADSILTYHKDVSAKIEPGFRERRFGVWEGLFFHDIEAGYVEDFQKWKKDPAGYKPQEGESVFDVQARVAPIIERVVNAYKGKVIVVVAHVGPIRIMVSDALGLSVDAYRRLQIDPASISVVDYGRSQSNLILLNYTDCLWG